MEFKDDMFYLRIVLKIKLKKKYNFKLFFSKLTTLINWFILNILIMKRIYK